MRKSTAALSDLALSTIVLTGCSAAAPTFEGAACDRDSSAALERSVTVTGDFGAPRVEIDLPVHTGEPAGQEHVIIGGNFVGSLTRHVMESHPLQGGSPAHREGKQPTNLVVGPAHLTDRVQQLRLTQPPALMPSRARPATSRH